MPPVKLFVDSEFRRDGSPANFSFALPRPVEINKQYRAMVDQIHVPHTWTTVVGSYNDALYLDEVFDDVGSGGTRTTRQRKVILTAKQYSGDELATEVQSKLNTGSFLPPNSYTVTFDDSQGKLAIQVGGASASSVARLLPMAYLLANPAYFTGYYGEGVTANDSADQVIGLTQLAAFAWTDPVPLALEHVSVNPFHTIYLHCDQGLGSGEDSIGPRGNSSILRSIPVLGPYGSMIHDNSLNAHDYTLLYPGQIQTFRFRLSDKYGRDVPLSMPFSFSILLTAVDDLE
jgi:hypothetical protein